MIWQTSRGLGEPLGANACALMTIWWYVGIFTRVEISPELIRWVHDRLLVPANAVTVDGLIIDWVEAYAQCGLSVVYMQSRATPEYACKPGEWEHLEWRKPSGEQHFTAGNGLPILAGDDERSHVTYDPMGESETVRVGRVASKRIFTRRK